MNGVIGMTGCSGTERPPEREYVETVRTSGDALLEIINDISISQDRGPRVSLETIEFSPKHVTEEASSCSRRQRPTRASSSFWTWKRTSHRS